MSMYANQQQAYGQVPYAAQAYGQRAPYPPQHQQAYPPAHYAPPPQPVYHVDPNLFRKDYIARLAELTVNSRPIIQGLSMMAQEYSRWADIVGQCIDAHIRRVPAWMKLPAFYVLDAISKNVYEPYGRTFATFIIPLFLDTYAQVDQPTRSKMEEMLLTWRTGAPNGKELFGIGPQTAIERGIWGGGSNHAEQGSSSRPSGRNPHISQAQVISELEYTIGQKQRALQTNPYDTVSQSHLPVLEQLLSLVQAGTVTQEELRQILGQLRTMTTITPAPTAAGQAPSRYPHHMPPTASTSFASTSSQPPFPPNFLPQQPFPPQQPAAAVMPPVVPVTTPAPTIPTIPNLDPSALQGLFASLIKAGIVPSQNSTPTGAGLSSLQEDVKSSADVNPERLAAREHRRAILSFKIKLSSADITKNGAPLAALHYNRLAAQCKQCGLRFPDSPQGKKDMETHLDMHFRQNRTATQNVGKGHSRSWFIGVDDWIHDVADVKGKGRADGPRVTMKEAAAVEAKKRDAELRAMHVIVPPGDEAKSIRCPICQETLKCEFLEDEEEWVWRNAIRKDDKIYHATCHAEASLSATTLAARLKSDTSTSRSRSGTPGTSQKVGMNKSASPPTGMSGAGIKRKADSEGSEGGTPPTKKLALTVTA